MNTRKHPSWLVIVLLFVLPFHMHSCMEELGDVGNIEKITISPKLPLPLIDDEIKLVSFLRDNIENGFISGNSTVLNGKPNIGLEMINGVPTLFYEDTVFSTTGEELFVLPNYDIPLTIQAPNFNGILPEGEQIAVPNQIGDFIINTGQSDELDSMVLKSGKLTVSIESDIPATTTINLAFSSIKMADGSILEKTSNLDGATTSAPVTYSLDLKDARIDFTKMATTFNTFTYTSSVNITGKGMAIAGTSVSCQIRLHDIQFKAIYGKFDTRRSRSIAGSMKIGTFDVVEIKNNPLIFETPSIAFNMDNGFGMPASFIIKDVDVIGAVQNEVITLSGPALEPPDNTYPLNYPNQLGLSSATEIDINTHNSNVGDIFSAFPYQVNYRFENTVGGLSKKGFMLDTSRITFRVRIKLPLYVRINDLVLNRDYRPNVTWTWLKKATIKVETTNASPINMRLQVYFKDDSNNIIDSLFVHNQNIAEAVPVDEHGVSSESSTFSKETIVSEEKMTRIKNAPIISFQARMSSLDNGSKAVKIMPENMFKVKIKLGLYTEYTLGD